MIQQGNRTQQLIYRTSYRKHRQRLADIRHNITGNDFMPQHKLPQSHKKYNYKDKLKKDEIEAENSVLKNKIGYIKNRGSHKIEELFSTEPIRKEPKRYFQQKGEKLKIDEDLNEGQQVKIIFPSKKIASFTDHVAQKQPEKSIGSGYEAKQTVLPSSKKRFSSYSVIKDRQKNKNQGKQKVFDYPERNQNRVVVFKKTIILGNMQSCLLQISFLEDRLLIAAYLMGLQNGTLRQLFNAQRSQQMIKQCDKDYAQLCERIKIQKIKDQFQIIRLIPKQNKEQESSIIKNMNQQQESKQRLKLQNDFLKRNYYTLNKAQVNEKIEEIKQKGGNANSQYIKSIVQRLALPKRLYKYRQQKTDKTQRVHKLNSSVNDKQSKIISSSIHQIHSQEGLSKKQAPYKENRYESKKEAHKQLQQNVKSKQSVKLNNKSIVESEKNQKYQEIFENNSSLITNKNPQNYSGMTNNKKEINPSLHQQSKKTEKINESNVYQQQFQKQQGNEQQKYQESFEKSNQMSPITKIQQSNKKAPQQVVQDQYHDQFQS